MREKNDLYPNEDLLEHPRARSYMKDDLGELFSSHDPGTRCPQDPRCFPVPVMHLHALGFFLASSLPITAGQFDIRGMMLSRDHGLGNVVLH